MHDRSTASLISTHCAAPRAEVVDAGHSEQELAPEEGWNSPAAHAVHWSDPESSFNLPGAHGTHARPEDSEDDGSNPGMHLHQVLPASALACRGHASHDVAPLPAWTVFAGHTAHGSEPELALKVPG
eukprot:3932528-Rhodomonas_salina.4